MPEVGIPLAVCVMGDKGPRFEPQGRSQRALVIMKYTGTRGTPQSYFNEYLRPISCERDIIPSHS